MQSDNGYANSKIQRTSIKEVVDQQFGSGAEGIGLVVAYQGGNIYIGFHKDYIEYETHNAIVFRTDEEGLMDLLDKTKKANVQ